MFFKYKLLIVLFFSNFILLGQTLLPEHNDTTENTREENTRTAGNQQEVDNQFALSHKRKEAINEVKKSQLLLMSMISLFVVGLISLIYYSKKVKIINKQLDFYSKENAFLLSEANHRINNNLQLIIILISDELKKNKESNENRSVKKILSKVESIATLHEHLYKSGDNRRINIDGYLYEIERNFDEIFKENNVTVQFSIAPIKLDNDTSMYLGLLLTELCINSLKHAFSEQTEKKIDFELLEENTIFKFKYRDNGRNSLDKQVAPKLAIRICNQLKVDYKITTENGFSLEFAKEIKIDNE